MKSIKFFFKNICILLINIYGVFTMCIIVAIGWLLAIPALLIYSMFRGPILKGNERQNKWKVNVWLTDLISQIDNLSINKN